MQYIAYAHGVAFEVEIIPSDWDVGLAGGTEAGAILLDETCWDELGDWVRETGKVFGSLEEAAYWVIERETEEVNAALMAWETDAEEMAAEYRAEAAAEYYFNEGDY
jgi:hypothetical protein